MIKQLRNIFNWIVFSNIFVAFCVLALTISSEVLLDTANFRISQFVFFATLFTYNFQRVVKLKQREKHLKTDWQAKNKTSTYFIMIISGIIIAITFIILKPQPKLQLFSQGFYPFYILLGLEIFNLPKFLLLLWFGLFLLCFCWCWKIICLLVKT